MNPTTVAIDLAKNVFELAGPTSTGTSSCGTASPVARFERFLASQLSCDVVMEACGTAHRSNVALSPVFARHEAGTR